MMSELPPARSACLLLAGLTQLVLSGATGAKEPQRFQGEGVFVYPQRAMAVAWNGDGTYTPLTGWIELTPPFSGHAGPGTATSSLNDFDAFLNDGNSCVTGGFPDCPESCCGPWSFNPDYCNTFAVAEMDAVSDGTSDRLEVAWYWYCSGSGVEDCYVAVLTGETPVYSCQGYNIQEGVVLGFGELHCNPGSFYFTDVCLCDFGLRLNTYAQGASAGILAREVQNGEFTFATCAQFMLFGNYAEGYFDLAGSHGPFQFDDDNPRDGHHDTPEECHNYTYGRCPDPLRWMMGSGDCDNIDCPSDACNGGESLRVRTRDKGCGCQVKAIVTGATPGASYGVILPNIECKTAVANGRGKAVAKHCPSRGGDVSVPTCGLRKTVTCP